MTPVIITNSSTIDALGYHGGDLFVRFKANGVYRYKGVPPEIVTSVTFADSVGKALNQFVKPRYEYVKEETSPFADAKVVVA